MEESFKDVIGNIDDPDPSVKGIDSNRIYKIVYVLNLIPSFGQHIHTKEVNG